MVMLLDVNSLWSPTEKSKSFFLGHAAAEVGRLTLKHFFFENKL